MVSVTRTGRAEKSTATVRINDDGTATLISGTCDCGTGSSTVLAQVVAEELGIDIERVEVQEGDTNLGLADLGSFSQRTIYVGGGAARCAAVAAREALLTEAAVELGRPRRRLATSNGNIVDSADAEFHMPLSEFCREYAAKGGAIIATETYRPGGNAPSYGACFASVVVDPVTGEVCVEHCLIALDCGRVLNPLGAAGQAYGGAVQGLSAALIEAFTLGEQGYGPTTIQEHGVAGPLDVPAITAVFTGSPEELGPYGAKGLGEVPVVPVAAAVANAVARATGVHVVELPLRPDVVWRSLQSASRYPTLGSV